ncbi:aspartic and glutamic acid-rich protein-like [Centruroides vittatus]|uniref:aspartic and glutamic acid-rich protein-like n=1 Tax=Centruroides vittatus TaxID=120091 RepID=UPI00350FD9A8
MASLSSHLIICYLFVAAISCYPVDKKATNQTTEVKDFQPVPLPTDFGSYDLDGNGYIDLKELAEVSETSHEEAKKPFVDADDDDDDQISPSEFEKAPWSLQGKVEDFRGEEDDNMEDILNDEEDMMMEAGEPVIEDEMDDDDDDKLKIDEENEKEVDSQRDEEVTDYDDDDGVKNLETDDDNDEDNDDTLKEEPLEEETDDDRSLPEEEAIGEEDDEEEEEDDDDDNEEIESDLSDPRLLEDNLRETGYGSEEETVENTIY